VKIIEITEDPIDDFKQARELPAGQIGEIIVQGPVVTREYYRQPEATRAAKIPDGAAFWHRMGDVGYLDETGALWFCGRKAHLVETAPGRLFTIPCEAIFNNHPDVFRSALVGIGEKPRQQPVIVVERHDGSVPTGDARERFFQELRELARGNPLTRDIDTFLCHPSLPVDIRHNVKIFREKLAPWAAKQLS
jgi:acyl-CoA synthetase (AMP-forming)/AMP-acid ligase II